MGQAREVMNMVTDAAVRIGDLKAVGECYAENAVIITPDQGEVTGRDQIIEWWRPFLEGFSELAWEPLRELEAGNTAIDEGWFGGVNTGTLHLPTGDQLPPTGKRIRVRGCDIATVQDGLIVEHHFYYDQMDFLGQLGLLQDTR
ncbi:MAG TPA: nuclear transport factor 2 family protein [Micromonosporaceae bacterium]|nr:nuclear transport factor 2 family protein [Micromonosporaceae bacterium]